ncbi:MAG: rhamnulokinase [Phycisphaerae bacterium]
MAEHRYLALDLGAESGRGIVATLAGGKISAEEIHRWPNKPVRMAGTLHWDVPYLFGEILQAIRICAEKKIPIESISVDTWGVDFGLLDRDGKLIGNPVNYRDGRTDGIHEYSDPIMSRREIYELTAYEPWQIASLFQLLSLKRDDSPQLAIAEGFLNMPDLMHYFLTGRRVSEMSIANTSNLMSTSCTWCRPIIERFGLKAEMFARLVPPATVIGPLSDEVCQETGIGDVPVVATCGHDTSGAVAAVPGEGSNWAFLSCGTWSIIGTLLDAPIPTGRALEMGFTNEYTIGGWYLARNISGLWLVQELRRKWDTASDPWDYNRMTAEAGGAPSGTLVNVADDSLLAPDDMEEALRKLIADSGQPDPTSRGELIRIVLDSLALEYNLRLDMVADLQGHKPEALYIVGGGIHNKLLCQLTANACGLDVYAGADQCTSMGNALGQALAMGHLDSPQAIRDVMRNSVDVTHYTPQDADDWADRRDAYAKLVS